MLSSGSRRADRPVVCCGLVLVAFVLIHVVRTPDVFSGRFWSEEGVYFAQFFNHGDVLRSLFLTGPGYPVLLTNAAVLLAELAPLPYAPFVTTAIGFAVECLLVVVLLIWHARLGLTLTAAATIALALAFAVHTSELTANSTNLQWLFAGICTLVLLDASNRPRWLSCAVLVLCGSSGAPAALLVPAFVIKWRLDRSPVALAQAVSLATPAVCIMTIGFAFIPSLGALRPYPLDPTVYGAAIAIHTTSLFLGYGIAEHLAQWYALGRGSAGALLVSISMTAAIAGLFAIGIARPASRRAGVLLAATYWISVLVGVFGSIAPERLLLVYPFSRYFFVPQLTILLMIGHIASTTRRPWLSIAVTACIAAFNLSPHPLMYRLLFSGPSWRAQVPADGVRGPTTIAIWPQFRPATPTTPGGWSITLSPRTR